MSQLMQVFMLLTYSVFYLLLVIDSYWLPKKDHWYLISLLAWLLSFALSYTLFHNYYIFEDLCLAYSSADKSKSFIFAGINIISIIGVDIIAVCILFKTSQIRNVIGSGRERTKKESITKWRIVLQLIMNSLHTFVFVLVYIMISSSFMFSNQALLALLDSFILIKSFSDPVLYTFTATSRWKKRHR